MNPSSTPAPARRALAAVLLAFACTAAAGAAPAAGDDPIDYGVWAREHKVHEFEAFLAESRLKGVVRTRHLLRTATAWRECGGPRWELPPRELWPEVAVVLRLVAELKRLRILQDVEAVSNYRNPRLNACAGGARRSSHTRSFAMDIVAEPGDVDVAALCSFWRSEGKTWRMGLSRYPSGRIHLDTSGHRTWGADHTSRTSMCLPPKKR